MRTTPVLYQRIGATGVISLNRPEKLNAINLPLLEGMTASFEEALNDEAVSVIVLQAEGRAFCAGDDLAEFSEVWDGAFAERFVDQLQTVTRQIMLGHKPVICAAQGWIVGGGASWLLNADFCLIGDGAAMFCPEARYGLFPSGGMSILLAERCGEARAADLLWLGKQACAEELIGLGIASRTVETERLQNEALELAQCLADLPAESRRRYKQARARDIGPRLELALEFEAECCLQAGLDIRTRERLAHQS